MARSTLRAQSDAHLTELARAGSEPAFEAIVARYRRSLMRYCAHLVGDADAEEATQDALLKAHAALLHGDPVRRLSPWLHVIAHNTALSYLRARSSRPQLVDVDHEVGATTDRSAEYREELNAVLEAVRLLPVRQRDAIVMRELEGRSYDEIAARLGSSNGAVRQLLNRARGSVRRRLGALLPVEPLVRWAIAGAGGAEAAGGATMSGACVLGTKACAAALLPATVALIVASAPAARHTSVTKAAKPAAQVTGVHRARREAPAPVPSRAIARSAGYSGASARLADHSGAPARLAPAATASHSGAPAATASHSGAPERKQPSAGATCRGTGMIRSGGRRRSGPSGEMDQRAVDHAARADGFGEGDAHRGLRVARVGLEALSRADEDPDHELVRVEVDLGYEKAPVGPLAAGKRLLVDQQAQHRLVGARLLRRVQAPG